MAVAARTNELNVTEVADFISRGIMIVAPCAPPYGGMALQAKQLEKWLAHDGHEVVFFPSNFALPGWLGRIPGFRTLLRAAAIWPMLWRRMAPVEVVHIFAASWLYFFMAVCPAVIVGRLRGKRVVLNYRGGEASWFFRGYGWIARPVLKLADVVTVPSGFLEEIMRKEVAVPAVIVPNILDTSLFRFRERRELQPKIIVTRHLEVIYDVETVLKAFRAVQERYPEASLLIAGTGTEANRLRAMAEAWALNNVRFLGHVPQAELPMLYDQCDILLNGSRVDNFPGALIEASAAGLAVVSTWAGGIPFLYENEVSALLVAPGDWKGLATAVERVLENPALARHLIAKATEVTRRCDWQQVRRALYPVYAEGKGTSR